VTNHEGQVAPCRHPYWLVQLPPAARERGEIEIISAYLPKQMPEAEAKTAVAEVVKATGATSMKDMGKVMAALKQGYAGKIDFGKASGWVKELLAG